VEAFQMKKSLVALAIAAAFAPTLAMAEAGDIVVRLRATNVSPDENSRLGKDTIKAYDQATADLLYGATNSAGAELRVDSNTIPEIDFSYYITKNIAAELILALGTRHDVSTSSHGVALDRNLLGSVNLLPPTLTAQWHFLPDQTFDPYVGAGLTFVRAMDNSLTARSTALGNQPIRIDHNSWGPAIQAGLDVNLQDKWLVNLDVKKVWFDTDVKLNVNGGGWRKIDTLDVDPWVISVGVGKKF
jgi:outer membrane protein